MAEGARLESVYTGNRIVGSNPTLSASSWRDILASKLLQWLSPELVVAVALKIVFLLAPDFSGIFSVHGLPRCRAISYGLLFIRSDAVDLLRIARCGDGNTTKKDSRQRFGSL